ncbi:MAG: succinate dehydrogenase, cytochrome b556 subunit [Gammaproteobacteria bacterium]|nr:succinate dehydrogenase, cytochrome b556 subunit [Gammaproteobacteria bacterium]
MAHRPLSPHLQIYRLPFAAILSITHRLTGVFLTLGSVLLVYWLVAIASGETAYLEAQALLGSWYGSLGLFLSSFALYFHLCNGVRHLFWDAGYGFELKTVDTSGQMVIILTVVLTVITWFIGSLFSGAPA